MTVSRGFVIVAVLLVLGVAGSFARPSRSSTKNPQEEHAVRDTEEVILNDGGFTGQIGDPLSDFYETYTRTIEQFEFQDQAGPFRIIFEVSSDPSFSDEDGDYPTAYGPFGVDDISLTDNIDEGNQLWDFEGTDHGFTAEGGATGVVFMEINDISDYTLDVPCANLDLNVLALHDENGEHPIGQHQMVVTPIVDLTTLGSVQEIHAEFDIYAFIENGNPVKVRSGWQYYPSFCSETGENTWSNRVGNSSYNTYGVDPVCVPVDREAIVDGVPPTAELVRYIFEILSCCEECWGQACTEPSNETPLIDNMRIRVVHSPGPEDPLAAGSPTAGTREETSFGFYTLIGDIPYAVEGETWTFDHGDPDPFEGLVAVAVSLGTGPKIVGSVARVIDAAGWAGHDNMVDPPIISGLESGWIGLFEDEADELCYATGLGYGDGWAQRFVSPLLHYDGSGSVELEFSYFNDTENSFDFTNVILALGGDPADAEEDVVELPSELRISSIQPNPTTGPTSLQLRIPAAGRLQVMVFDPGGRLIRDLGGEPVQPGSHHIIWDGQTDEGRKAVPGVYFVHGRLIGSRSESQAFAGRIVVLD